MHVIHYDLKDIPLQEFTQSTADGLDLPFYIVEFRLTMRLDPRTLHMELRLKGQQLISSIDVTDPDDAAAVPLSTSRSSSPVSQPIVDQAIPLPAVFTAPITESIVPPIDSIASVTESTVPTTVSGLPITISTLPTTVSGHQDKSIRDYYDAQSINTDGQSLPNLPELVREKLISKIGLEILESTESFLPALETTSERAATATKIASALPTLLKEFSRELAIVAQPGIQRKAVTFVRRYRRYLYIFIDWSTNQF